MKVLNLADKFSQFQDHWNPRIIGALNGQHVKIAKIQGPFIWHSHEQEDELFLVVKGTLKMEFRDRTEVLEAGEIIIIPRGVEHRPVADEEVQILLFEPARTVNTGETEQGELTREELEWI